VRVGFFQQPLPLDLAMSLSLPSVTSGEGVAPRPMLSKKNEPPPALPEKHSSIWTNAFGEAMGGIVMLILGGVAWLTVSLPAALNEIKTKQQLQLGHIERVVEVQEKHEAWLRDHERRLVREEAYRGEAR